MAARKKKRGPSLDDKYLGPEPIYTEESEFNDLVWTKGAHWYNYFLLADMNFLKQMICYKKKQQKQFPEQKNKFL